MTDAKNPRLLNESLSIEKILTDRLQKKFYFLLISIKHTTVVCKVLRVGSVIFIQLQSTANPVQAHVFIHKENTLIKHQVVVGAKAK